METQDLEDDYLAKMDTDNICEGKNIGSLRRFNFTNITQLLQHIFF